MLSTVDSNCELGLHSKCAIFIFSLVAIKTNKQQQQKANSKLNIQIKFQIMPS